MYGGSHVVNLFKKAVRQKTIFAVPWHNTTILFVISSLTSLQKSSIHKCMEERYVYTLSQIKTYTVWKKCSQRNITQKQL